MSRRVGGELDGLLFARLSGAGLSERPHEAILLATTDDRGRPHPALLAYGEVVALSPSRLRLAVSRGGTTARNLQDRGALTLCLVGPEGAAWVKASARALAVPALAEEGLAAFEASVEDVLVDTPRPGEEARLTSGITFVPSDPARQAREAALRLDSLRQA